MGENITIDVTDLHAQYQQTIASLEKERDLAVKEMSKWAFKYGQLEAENAKLKGADEMIREIEEMYPNWHKFRDLAEAVKWHTTAQDKIIARLREDNEGLRAISFIQSDIDELRPAENADLQNQLAELRDRYSQAVAENKDLVRRLADNSRSFGKGGGDDRSG